MFFSILSLFFIISLLNGKPSLSTKFSNRLIVLLALAFNKCNYFPLFINCKVISQRSFIIYSI